jgi:histidinol phosphatase-like PHP family hydrolase
MLYDFHTHTFLSDGVLSPIELIRRCIVNGYSALGIADHAGASTLERVVAEVRRDAELAQRHWGFTVLAGIELTHVPAASIAELAGLAKKIGADHVVVHGESPVEPVEEGTNLAAASCPDVDILAHPGLLSAEAAAAAAANGVYIEVTAKDGHSLGNGHVVRVAQAAGARLIVDSDSHVPGQILTEAHARRVALCAGLAESELETVLITNPQALLARAIERRA